MRAMVTGGTGFVGANLVRRLVRQGYEVHLLVRPGHARWRISDVLGELRLHESDLSDADQVGQLVSAVRPVQVFHLAVHGAYPSQTDYRRMVETNVVGTMNLVHAALLAGVEVFVNTGSSSEYGFKDHPPAEDEMVEPNSPYAVTKASATMFCQYLAREHGMHVPTLRLYSVFGPYEEPTRLIPTLIMRGLKGEFPPLAAPDIARDYVYVGDVVDAYLLAANRPSREPGPIFNVGTGTQTTLRELIALARQTLPVRGEPSWGSMPNRRWDTGIWVANSHKIQGELGWRPSVDLAHGLRATIAWLTDDPTIMELYARGSVGHPAL